MSSSDDPRTESTDRDRLDWSRRTLLRAGGAGAGAAALGGLTLAGAAAQEEDDDEDEDEDDGEDGADGDAFLSDLIDPTFGYPFAADETGDVDVGAVVEMTMEQGAGAHEEFPMDQEGSEVESEFLFDPVGLAVEPDTVVHFVSVAGEHTATAFHEKFGSEELPITTRVPEGVPGFTSPPVVGGESWVYEFSETGVYDLLCLPHLGFGMVMRLVVSDPEADESFAAPEGDVGLPNVDAVLNAPELAPSNVVEAGEVAWADLTIGEEASTGTETGTGTGTETGTGTGTETGTDTDV